MKHILKRLTLSNNPHKPAMEHELEYYVIGKNFLTDTVLWALFNQI